LASLESAWELEQAAHVLQFTYIRVVREAVRSWFEIGEALELRSTAIVARESIAEFA
jgi:hypothetical protein